MLSGWWRGTHSQSIITGISTDLTDLGSGDWFGIPHGPVLALVVVVYYARLTPFGRYLPAPNRGGAIVGLPVERLVMLAFVISGTLAGLAGVLLVARSSASPRSERSATASVAAVFLGATAIKPGRFNVLGTLM
jgi:ribose transport system permease protein